MDKASETNEGGLSIDPITGRVTVIVLLLITVPFLLGFFLPGEEAAFGGFLFNPLDGNSYLAKMQQGLHGEWTFTLPFTANPGQGEPLFLFYILLGHLCRIFSIPVVYGFHLARVLCAVLLMGTLWKFTQKYFWGSFTYGHRAFYLIIFGGGLGWLLFPTGLFTSDFWVAEAYPLLSMYANPHFPLGLSLLLELFLLLDNSFTIGRVVIGGLFGLLLSAIMPFGVVVLVLVWVGRFVWEWFDTRSIQGWQVALVSMLTGGLFLIHQFVVIRSHPVLRLWDLQNLTPSPPIWDVVISLSPAMILAVVGLWASWQGTGPFQKGVAIWFVFGLLLMYVPFNLQRRFMLGLYIPTGILALEGLQYLARRFSAPLRRLAWRLLFILSLPTGFLVLASGWVGVFTQDTALFLSKGESAGLQWMRENSDVEDIILCSPELGAYIPAQTGRRVVYGHPFETVNADMQKMAVEEFFANGATDGLDRWKEMGVDLLWVGPREVELGAEPGLIELPIVYEHQGVTIFSLE